jgi:hypothetical protein
MFRRVTLLVAAIALSGASLRAHDMWIEPMTFVPDPGEIVGVGLRVGQDLLGDRLPRDPSLINQFVVEDAEGRKPVVGRTGSDPAGFVRAATPGLLVIGYWSNPSLVQETAEKFNQYLKEEGLDAVAALRARRGQTAACASCSSDAPRVCCSPRPARRRAIARLASRWRSWPSATRTR